MLDYLKSASKTSPRSEAGVTSSANTSVSSGTSQSRALVPVPTKQSSFKITHTKSSAQSAKGKFITLDLVTDLVGLAGLQKDWNSLFAKCYLPGESHMGHAWHYSRCTALQGKLALAGYSGLAIIVGRYDGQVVMIWPMAVYDVLGVRQLKWIGEATKEYCDVLVLDHPLKTEWLERAFTFLRDQIKPDMISMKNTRQNSSVADMIRKKGALSHIPLKVSQQDWHDETHWNMLGKRPVFSGSFKIRRKRLSDKTSSYSYARNKKPFLTKPSTSKALVPVIVDHEQNVTVCDYSLPLSKKGYAYTYIALMALRAGLYG